jgi:hypothetical protein
MKSMDRSSLGMIVNGVVFHNAPKVDKIPRKSQSRMLTSKTNSARLSPFSIPRCKTLAPSN